MSAAVNQPIPASTYADAWPVLRADGWTGTLPLPAGKKVPPPTGTTGWDSPDPSAADCAEWAEQDSRYRGSTQLGLRMPSGVIGIDVDAYGAKRGRWTLQEAARRWGPLPAGPSTSSREDGISGIYLFRVPTGTVLLTNIAFPELPDTLDEHGSGGIEVIQRHHRYAVAWPSIHPTGKPYTWRGTAGPGIHPRIDELPNLPEAWIGGLQSEAEPFVRRAGFGEANQLLHSMPAGECVTVSARLADALTAARGGSRHDRVRDHVLALLRLGEQGHQGVPSALEMLEREFAASVADRATAREALAEFDRMVYGSRGMGLLLANRTAVSDYGCRHGTTAPELTTIEYQPPATSATSGVEWAPAGTVVATADPNADEQAKATALKWQVDVWNEQYKLKVRDEATRLHRLAQRAHRPSILSGLIDDLDAIPEPEMLLGSLIPERAIGFLAGRSGAYKSFLATSWACCIATGTPWLGRSEFRVARPLRTIYVAAEGASGAAGRIKAWEAGNGVSRRQKLKLYDRPIHLNDQDRAEELAEVVAATGVEFIVIDTYHRSAPGTEENSSTDFGVIFEAVARLRDEYGCGVLFVDHTGFSFERMRGTSAKGDDADYWHIATYEGEDRGPHVPRTLKVRKLKDEESSGEWSVKLSEVEGARFPLVTMDSAKAIAGPEWRDQLKWPLPEDVQTMQPKAAKDGRARGRAGIAPLALYMRENAPNVDQAVGVTRAEAIKAVRAAGEDVSASTLEHAWSALVEHSRLMAVSGTTGTGRHVWVQMPRDPGVIQAPD